MARALGDLRITVAALIACAVLAAGCDWPWRHDMADQPSPSSAAGPRSPAPGAISREARGPFDRVTGEDASNPLPPDPSGNAAGRALYNTYCVPCHGGPVEQYFPRMPPLNAPELLQHGDGWWYATITKGTSLMPAFGHELEPAERWRIVQFIRTQAGT